MDMKGSLYSPYDMLGVVRDSLSIAWDMLCQEVVMLAKEGDPPTIVFMFSTQFNHFISVHDLGKKAES